MHLKPKFQECSYQKKKATISSGSVEAGTTQSNPGRSEQISKVICPKMDTVYNIKFPELTRYHGMPRRYEETRPVVVQTFAHRKILGLGHDIHVRLMEHLESEKTEAIQRAEKEIWRQADIRTEMAIKATREEMAEEVAKALAEQGKMHEQHIKEECLKIEMTMQKMAIEQVKEEREKGEKLLAETVIKIEEKCAQEKAKAVTEAHREEQTLAAETIRNLRQYYNKELQSLKMKAEEEKKNALNDLEDAMNKQCQIALRRAHAEEQKTAREHYAIMREEFHEAIELQSKKTEAKMEEILVLKEEIAKLEQEKKNLIEYLEVSQKSFQECLQSMKIFDGVNVECMLPPINFEEIQQGLMIAK